VALVLMAALVGGAFGVRWLLKQEPGEEQQQQQAAHESIYNYRFSYPSGWKVDTKLKQAMGANLALTKSEGGAGLAIFARDYKTRTARDAEMHDQAVIWLEISFRGFEFEMCPDQMLDGQGARRFEFQGELDHVLIKGECLMTARRGYAYWVVAWAPAYHRDTGVMEWRTAIAGFHFLNNREGWVEKKPRQIPIQGEKAPYRLSYTEGVWEKQSIDVTDPRTDLVLLGYDPRETDRLAEKAGTVTILRLPPADGDLKSIAAAAREYMLARQRELYPETTVEVVADKTDTAEGTLSIGGVRVHVGRFRVKNSPQRELYTELVTAPMSNGVLVMQCECLWSRREFFKQEFAPLRETLRIGKNK
jgi:hypothetical protein